MLPIGLNLQQKLFIGQKFETQISIKKHAWMILCFVLAFYTIIVHWSEI